jgi:benzaldehyde dehydrogenase (NAD)
VQQSAAPAYVEGLAAHADALPVGDPFTDEVALGPLIDTKARDKVDGMVRRSLDAGARLAAGGRYEGLFYRPTVLADVAPNMPAYTEEIFGPVAPVTTFATLEQAVELAAGSGYGLSLGILTGNLDRGLELAERIPTGIVHINDQTVNDEAVAPFGGVRDSGTGVRFGGDANLNAFTDTRWVTMRGEPPPYPF